MNIARPTVAEERWLQVGLRHRALRDAVGRSGHEGGWKTTTWRARCLGFLLGLFAASLLAGALAMAPSPLLVGGLGLVLAAEWLVAKRRVFHSGIEEALYLCGVLALVAQVLVWGNAGSAALAVALAATGVLFVGWRLLNALFTTLAAAGYPVAIALAGEKLLAGRLNTLEAAALCAIVAVVALVAGGRTWSRPSHDRMLDGLVVTMSWLAWGWLLAHPLWGRNAPLAGLALASAFLVVNAATGLARRQHAPLIAALGNLACVAWSLHELLRWPVHRELIGAGLLLLVAALLVDRRLQHRGQGITSRALADDSGLDLAQLAGAAGLAVPAAGAAAPQGGFEGQGGDFGGGGASGRF